MWVATPKYTTIQGIDDLKYHPVSALEALCFGRYGVQFKCTWERFNNHKILTVGEWEPVNGDKIGHMLDGTPYVLVYGAQSEQLGPSAELGYSTIGKMIELRGWWREHFMIHRHLIQDSDYFDVEGAEAIHGLGIRSRIFWLNWTRLEYSSWVSDFLQRLGLGLTVWFYELGNDASRKAVEKAARQQRDTGHVLFPRSTQDTKGAAGIERIETPATGAEVIRALVEIIREDINRYIVGQTMSSKAEGNSLGGTGVADFQKDTKLAIAGNDAELLASTLTGSARNPGLVWMIQRWSFPETLPGRPGGFPGQVGLRC